MDCSDHTIRIDVGILAELVLVDVAVDPILYERQCCLDGSLLSLVGFVAEVLTFIDLLKLDL